MKTLLNTSNLILFFSLPFKPLHRWNLFFSGHIALALNKHVFQIYNPYLLKSDFLFSIMPADSWLFGKGGQWIERNPASPNYKHVYLYKKSESYRTAVYGAGLSVDQSIIEHIKKRFIDEDKRFQTGISHYNFFRNNCSSIISDALIEAGLIKKNPLNSIPACFFKRFIANSRRRHTIIVKNVSQYDNSRFALHHFCFGLWSFNPRRAMDRWIFSHLKPGMTYV